MIVTKFHYLSLLELGNHSRLHTECVACYRVPARSGPLCSFQHPVPVCAGWEKDSPADLPIHRGVETLHVHRRVLQMKELQVQLQTTTVEWCLKPPEVRCPRRSRESGACRSLSKWRMRQMACRRGSLDRAECTMKIQVRRVRIAHGKSRHHHHPTKTSSTLRIMIP